MGRSYINIDYLHNEEILNTLNKIKDIAEQTQNPELKAYSLLLEEQLHTPIAALNIDYWIDSCRHAPLDSRIRTLRIPKP